MIQNNKPPRRPEPQRLRVLRQGRPALHRRRGPARRRASDLLDAFAKGGTYNGKLYGFPILVERPGLLLQQGPSSKKAGIAAPPKTWDEFEADAKKVTGLGDGTIGYALPLGPEESQGEFSMWLFNNGGDWKKDGKWTINSPRTSRR